ncbi:hypothetical protein IQ238_24725 [Pleurocapsales cyanobacterium LEGE 06147]|nr:hypothetical protein [Pleurocapsales cyanobacterium LEGE 06147]
MSNIQIETDLAEILKEIKSDQKAMLEEMRSGQKEILKKVNELEVSLAEIKGDIKTLDTKVEQLDKRISNSEFTNRGILIGLVVVILGSAAKFFGLVGNP